MAGKTPVTEVRRGGAGAVGRAVAAGREASDGIIFPQAATAVSRDSSPCRRLRHSRAVSAGVRCSVVYLGFRVMQDGLAATHCGGVFVPHIELMSHGREFLPRFWRHTRLDHDVASAL